MGNTQSGPVTKHEAPAHLACQSDLDGKSWLHFGVSCVIKSPGWHKRIRAGIRPVARRAVGQPFWKRLLSEHLEAPGKIISQRTGVIERAGVHPEP